MKVRVVTNVRGGKDARQITAILPRFVWAPNLYDNLYITMKHDEKKSGVLRFEKLVTYHTLCPIVTGLVKLRS